MLPHKVFPFTNFFRNFQIPKRMCGDFRDRAFCQSCSQNCQDNEPNRRYILSPSNGVAALWAKRVKIVTQQDQLLSDISHGARKPACWVACLKPACWQTVAYPARGGSPITNGPKIAQIASKFSPTVPTVAQSQTFLMTACPNTT